MPKIKKRKINKVNYKNNPIFNEFIAEATLDFHDRGILNEYEVEKILSEFIEDSIVSGFSRLIVVTGKGQFVKPLVSKLLKLNKSVKIFKRAGYFNGQDGAFEVEV